MITDNLKLKFAFKLFSLLCAVGAGICLVCDFALNRGISWSAYVLASVGFGWAIAVPLLLSKANRLIHTLAVLMVSVFPYLFILSKLTPVTGWFTPLALPIGITVIAALWLTYLLFRFAKINMWYLFSGMIILYGIIVNSVVQYCVSVFADDRFISLDYLINLITCIVVTVLLFIIGRYSDMSKKNSAQVSQTPEPSEPDEQTK